MMPICVLASEIDDGGKMALLEATKSIGETIFQQCIQNIPINQAQILACNDLYYKHYLRDEVLLTLPNIVKKSLDPSPYSKSQWDICKNETGHVIFSEYVSGMPYCTVNKF